ncbi:MAG: hypothetical protein FJ119_03265 [Deltaproteobacteria bacterium]|nr:hypothetical protein [Deltaproteobacteria bacterium]
MNNKKKIIIALLFLLVTCAALICVFFSPRDMLSAEPVYSDDYTLHYSSALAARTFWGGWGRCWGYDPYLLAGFPNGALANADNKAWELVVITLGPLLGYGRAFKVYVLVSLLFFPLLLYAAARNFNLSRGQALGASVLSFFFFYLSLPKDFVLWGMTAYIVSCFFSVYVLSLLFRLLAGSFSSGLYCWTIVCASLLLLNHILSPMHIVLPAGLLYVLFARRVSKSRLLLIAAIPFAVAAANMFWLVPVFDFLHDKTTTPEHYEFALQIKDFLEPFNVYVKQRRGIAHSIPVLNSTFIEAVLMVLGIFGCGYWWRNGQRRLASAFGGGIVFIFLVTFYGSHMPFFSQFQPQRFANALNVLLLIPAGIGLTLCLDLLFRRRSRFEVLMLSAVLFVILYQPAVRPFLTIARSNLYRLNCTMPPPVIDLVDFLAQHTTPDGRILIEDSEFINEPGYSEPEAYYGTHLPGLFPALLKREYLCGPRPMYPIKHSFASFTRGVLFDRPIADYSLQELQAAFDLFNVRWIVCWFDESCAFFDALPQYIRKAGAVDKFTVYEVLREPSFFIKGSGRVTSDYNRIELSDVQAEDEEVIISYHWMQYLVTDSGAQLERVMIGDDPIGFIKIKNPPKHFTIYNGY